MDSFLPKWRYCKFPTEKFYGVCFACFERLCFFFFLCKATSLQELKAGQAKKPFAVQFLYFTSVQRCALFGVVCAWKCRLRTFKLASNILLGELARSSLHVQQDGCSVQLAFPPPYNHLLVLRTSAIKFASSSRCSALLCSYPFRFKCLIKDRLSYSSRHCLDCFQDFVINLFLMEYLYQIKHNNEFRNEMVLWSTVRITMKYNRLVKDSIGSIFTLLQSGFLSRYDSLLCAWNEIRTPCCLVPVHIHTHMRAYIKAYIYSLLIKISFIFYLFLFTLHY